MRLELTTISLIVIALCASTAMGDAIPLDKGGASSGWSVTPSHTDILVEVDSITSTAVTISITKTLDAPSAGELSTRNLVFQQTGTDANTVSQIIIADEEITNDSGYTWTAYRWVILSAVSGDPAKFNTTASASWDVTPFTTSQWVGVSGSLADELKASGGLIPDDSDANPDFTPSGNLVIDVDTSGMMPVVFSFKQIAVPEPCAMGIVAVGGMFLLRRRKHRKL